MSNTAGLFIVRDPAGAFVHDTVDNVEIVHVFGDVDIASAADLEACITNATPHIGRVVIDFTECRYVDSSAIAVLIRAFKRLGERLKLVVGTEGTVARVLDICGLSSIFSISGSLAEAVAA